MLVASTATALGQTASTNWWWSNDDVFWMWNCSFLLLLLLLFFLSKYSLKIWNFRVSLKIKWGYKEIALLFRTDLARPWFGHSKPFGSPSPRRAKSGWFNNNNNNNNGNMKFEKIQRFDLILFFESNCYGKKNIFRILKWNFVKNFLLNN